MENKSDGTVLSRKSLTEGYILVAPNAMKGSLDAFSFGEAIAKGLSISGIKDVYIQPIADGGDGSAMVLADKFNAKTVVCKVHDPLMRIIDSRFYISPDNIAIIEMADASGLRLLTSSERNAMNTSTFGTGELISKALDLGARQILVGLGGSATNDGGIGALMALGFEFNDKSGNRIEIGCGKTIGDIETIDTSRQNKLLQAADIHLLVDVRNKIVGKDGATSTFARQKGASEADIPKLEQNLKNLVQKVSVVTQCDVETTIGGGAAGGFAAIFAAFTNAKIENGAEFIFEKIDFKTLAGNCLAIITGEGCLDEQTFMGKAPSLALRFGIDFDKPVFVICGQNITSGNNRFDGIISLSDYYDIKTAIYRAYDLIIEISSELGSKIINMKNNIKSAREAFDSNRLIEAEQLLNELLAEDPIFIDALLLRSQLFHKQQQWGKAINDLKIVLKQDPENQFAQNYLKMIEGILEFWHKDNYNP